MDIIPKEIKIPVPWGHIAAKTWGSKNSFPILVIHGHLDNSASFDRLIPLLPHENYYFVCIDLPGHGISSHIGPGVPYQFYGFVTSLKRIQNYFKWEKMHILGHSMGGIIGTVFATVYPEAVEKLMLLDVYFFPVPNDAYDQTIRNVKHILNVERNLSSEAPEYTKEEAINKIMEKRITKLQPLDAELLLGRNMKRVNESNKYKFTFDQRIKKNVRLPMDILGIKNIVNHVKCQVLLICAVESSPLFHSTAFKVTYQAFIEKLQKFLEHKIVARKS